MFCGKCGAEVAEGEKFCGACGELMEANGSQSEGTLSQDGAGESQDGAGEGLGQYDGISAQDLAGTKTIQVGNVKLDNKKIGIIACGVALLLLIIGAFAVFSGNGPQAVLKKYMSSSIRGDYGKAQKYSAYDVDNLVKEIYTAEGMSKKEFYNKLKENEDVKSLKALYSKYGKLMNEQFIIEYGSNYKVKTKITDSEKISKEDMNIRIEALKKSIERRGWDYKKFIKLDKVKAMTEYEVVATIEGKKNQDEATVKFYMVKIGGKWLVLDDFNLYY